MRERSIRKGRATHLTRYSIVRVAIATFVYSIMCFSSYLPTLIFFSSQPSYPTEHTWPILNMDAASPYYNTIICSNRFADSRLFYFGSIRCPNVASFLPSLVGIAFFVMYGFGKHARRTYTRFFETLKCL